MRGLPLLDLVGVHADLREGLHRALDECLGSGRFVGGGAVDAFEESWARRCGTDFAVGVANGTDALEIALRAVGVQPGDEVIVPANTFIATASAVVAVGARPVFVDVDPGSLLVTADAVEAGLNHRTTAVVVVHLYGQAADMDQLSALCSRRGLALVEDCAQAHGAAWRGRPVGSWGAAGCFSFYPGKNLGALGDAGAVVTSDSVIAAGARSISNHGRSPGSRYVHDRVGRNSRLDALQAAFLSVKLEHLPVWNRARTRIHEAYVSELADHPEVRFIDQHPSSDSVFHLEVVEVEDRNAVVQRLAADGVETGIHYPVPCPRQAPYEGYRSALIPVTERASGRIVSLPNSPGMTADDVRRVARSLTSSLSAATSGPRAGRG